MKVILKKLKLTNFKGIKDIEVDFNEDITYICGDNGTGKTTIFDAFLWLLFGKDSQDRKDFGIKTLDKDGKELHKIEHNVTAVIEMNGKDKVFSRTLREKWVKKKGSTEETFDGNETLYEIDNVPLKQSEYIQKTALINEDLFKLITNPTQFCNLKWQKQREILMNMANIDKDIDIANKHKMINIVELLESGKSVEERVKELANSKRKITKEIDVIPVRIDEISRTLTTNNARTYDNVSADIKATKDSIREIEKEINSLSDNNVARMKIETKIKQIEAEMFQAEAEHKIKFAQVKANNAKLLQEHSSKISKLEEDIKFYKSSINECKKDINDCNNARDKLREDFCKERDTEFNNTVCPCCGRAWEQEDLQEKLAEFNANKVKRLEEIQQNGKAKKASVENLERIIEKKNKDLEVMVNELDSLKNNEVEVQQVEVFNSNEYIERIEQAKLELKNNKVDTSKQEADIILLNSKLAVLEQELTDINGITKQKERIAELEKELTDKVQAIADIEKEETQLKVFTDTKIALLNEAINNKFKLVKFKLYDTQINGGYVECCEATVDGVPYRDLNNAMKINAGLDIINVLQKKYNTLAPVFIDNKESINEPLKLECQAVCLVVTNDKSLMINNNKEAA